MTSTAKGADIFIGEPARHKRPADGPARGQEDTNAGQGEGDRGKGKCSYLSLP